MRHHNLPALLLSLALATTLLPLTGCQAETPAAPQNSSSSGESPTGTTPSGSSTPENPNPEYASQTPENTPKTPGYASQSPEKASQTPEDGDACTLPPLPTALSRTYPTDPQPGYDPSAPSPQPATQSWALAYESFYSGGPPAGFQEIEGFSTRENLLFPIYQTPYSYERDGVIALTDILREKGPAFIEELLIPPEFYGVLLNTTGTDTFAGEGLISKTDGGWGVTQITHHPVGNYYARFSMTITENIEAQLLSLGFTPAGTSAKALWIPGYTNGVLFSQGELHAFLISSDSLSTSQWIHAGVVYLLEDIVIDMANHLELFDPQTSSTPSSGETYHKQNPDTAKPVIYLYPEEETVATVRLDYPAPFTYTYPAYGDGWKVLAHPDGRLQNLSDGLEVHYLFWEGDVRLDWDFSQGFVIKGSDTEAFLEKTLTHLGLTSRERGDFITYWAPEMVQNDYNLITFSTTQYEALAPLTVTPTPDSVLRVHMVYKPCPADTKVSPQTLTPGTRSGFSVVEWGGTRAR